MVYRKNRKQNESHEQAIQEVDYQFVDELKEFPISLNLEENEQYIKKLFTDCSDAVIRTFEMENGIEGLIVFIDGLVNSEWVDDAMKSLMILEGEDSTITGVKMRTLPVSQTNKVDNYGELLINVLGGDAALFIQRQSEAIMLGVRGGNQRSVSEPETETVVRGPREGFVENIRVNTSLLRRKLKTPRMKMKALTVGKESNTSIVVCYLENIADPDLVDEVVQRIKKIDVDIILESGYIEEFIQDSYLSPFPQVQYSERPDTVAAALGQGRIAIIVDGTPMVLIVPFVLWQIIKSNEDYYERFQIMTLIRWLRYIFLVLSLTAPALYVAITTFHQDMLPTSLMLSIAAARESIPFPAVVEALIMEVIFEALREAGIRLPKAVGSAVSILGALVVGQAAVEAGIVSAPMVIVVSITGIASFTIPQYNGAIAIRMLRFPLMIVASLFGMYGIMISIMIIIGHLSNLRSFGVPYLSPVAPLSAQNLKDILVRAPWPSMDARPNYMGVQDVRRMGKDIQKEIKKQEGQKGYDIQHDDPSSQKGE